MEVVHARCAGLDVHKKLVVACSRVIDGGRVTRQKARFGTTTRELQRLAEWLQAQAVTQIVMESTGVFWRPVWHVLGEHFALLLANARHVKAVPGRKSDMNDAEWLAELLAHGLLRGSFVPPREQQERRDLTRTRKQVSRARAQQALRIQKVLEDANIKLASVVSDILGKASRTILEALCTGEAEPAALVARRGQLKVAPEALAHALEGRLGDHHRFLLRLHLTQVDALDQAMHALDERLAHLSAPLRQHLTHLAEIPGVSTVIAQVIAAEVGTDMSRFPTHHHLVSWAGLCPRLDESAGKIRSRAIRKGNAWLKTDLTQAAQAARRAKTTYLSAQFHRLAARRGAKRATVAVAASILTAAYFILRDGVSYHDLGADYLDRRDAATVVRKLAKRIEALGYAVDIRAA